MDISNYSNPIPNFALGIDPELLKNTEFADWIYDKVCEQIKEFQDALDEEHEVGLMLASFGQSMLLRVTDLGYQNPNLMYFYGFYGEREAQLIQHMSQLNFLLCAVEKEPDRPLRRIGFASLEDPE